MKRPLMWKRLYEVSNVRHKSNLLNLFCTLNNLLVIQINARLLRRLFDIRRGSCKLAVFFFSIFTTSCKRSQINGRHCIHALISSSVFTFDGDSFIASAECDYRLEVQHFYIRQGNITELREIIEEKKKKRKGKRNYIHYPSRSHLNHIL